MTQEQINIINAAVANFNTDFEELSVDSIIEMLGNEEAFEGADLFELECACEEAICARWDEIWNS